jgi:acetoacetyl-CoA reductase
MEAKVPLGRFAPADEVARHALYLLAPVSGWITGTCLTVDGGRSLPPPMGVPGTRVER